MGGNDEGHDQPRRLPRQLAREDISLTHTIVHPTVDRATDANLVGNPCPAQGRRHRARDRRARRAHPGHAGAVRRRARRLSRPPAAAGADALRAQLLDPDGHARARVPVPRQRCRHPAPAFDRPLSTRFDEQDAFVIFDDVEVPRSACSSTPTRGLQLGDGPTAGGRTSCSRRRSAPHQARVRLRARPAWPRPSTTTRPAPTRCSASCSATSR